MYVLVFSTAIIKVEKQQGINSGKNPKLLLGLEEESMILRRVISKQ